MDRAEFALLLDEKLAGFGQKLEEKLEQKLEEKLEQKLEEKLEQKLAGFGQKLEEKLEQKLLEKLQPLWQGMSNLSSRVNVIEGKLDEVAKDVQQIKYDTTKLRGRLNRVDLEELRIDVDAIKATLGLE